MAVFEDVLSAAVQSTCSGNAQCHRVSDGSLSLPDLLASRLCPSAQTVSFPCLGLVVLQMWQSIYHRRNLRIQRQSVGVCMGCL